MKERPIIFSAPMVFALLAGTKTQTRRVCKVQPSPWKNHYQEGGCHVSDWEPAQCDDGAWDLISGYADNSDKSFGRCPYGAPGDRLLVASEIPSSPNDDYCAGSDGQIYSRTRYAGFGRKERVDWYPLAGARNRKGYVIVSLCHENRKITRSVHSLVCEAFYGPAPFKAAQVRHLDGDGGNNVPSNLAWGTQAENWTDRRAQGRGVEGEKHHASKLKDDERAHVRWAIERGLCSQRHAARALGMSQGSISALLDGVELRESVVADPGLRIPCITLEITDVRVERLQSISEENARAEGVTLDVVHICPCKTMVEVPGAHIESCPYRDIDFEPTGSPFVDRFSALWTSINGKTAPWSANPFVWAVSFLMIEGPANAKRAP